jgi:hypothetical protein
MNHKLYLVVNGKLVDLSFMSDYLKDNIEHWIAEIYIALKDDECLKK